MKWILAGAAAMAGALAAVPAAGATSQDVQFADVCGGVTVTAAFPDGTDVRISRAGTAAGGFRLSGGTFTVAAHHGLTIGVAIGGGPEVAHTYADPAGCSSLTHLTATFDDWCFDRVHVTLTGANQPATPGFIVDVNGTDHAVPAGTSYRAVDSVPDNALVGVYRRLPDGARAYYANHVYRTPTSCGTGSLSVRFTDHCYGVRAEVTSTASGIQSWSAFHGQEVLPSPWVRGNSTTVQQIPGVAEGTAIVLKLLTPPEEYTEFARHTYRKPDACTSPWKTAVSFVDGCTDTSLTVTRLADVREYWIDADGRRYLVNLTEPGESKTVQVQGSTVVVSAGGRMEGEPDRTIARHVHTAPAGCGGLPVTGPATVTMAVSGVLIGLLGAVTFVFSRRRRL